MTESFARLMRTSCNECGSKNLSWSSLAGLLEWLPFKERSQVRELVRMLGGSNEAWRCLRCGQYGVFGPSVFAG